MKITAVNGFPVKIGHRNQFVIKIETDEGIHGLGEGGISGRELAMQGMLDHFSPRPDRTGPATDRAHLATALPGRLFRRRQDHGRCGFGSRYRAVGHPRQVAQCPGLATAGWSLSRHDPLLRHARPLNGPKIVDKARAAVADGWRVLRFTPGMPDTRRTGGDGAVFEPLSSIDAAVEWLRESRRSARAGCPALDRLPPPAEPGRGRALLPACRSISTSTLWKSRFAARIRMPTPNCGR